MVPSAPMPPNSNALAPPDSRPSATAYALPTRLSPAVSPLIAGDDHRMVFMFKTRVSSKRRDRRCPPNTTKVCLFSGDMPSPTKNASWCARAAGAPTLLYMPAGDALL